MLLISKFIPMLLEREAEIRICEEQKWIKYKDSSIHLAIDSFGIPLGVTITSGTIVDSAQAENLLVDRGCDTNKVIRYAASRGIKGIAARYARTTSSYLASVQICCLFIWLQII